MKSRHVTDGKKYSRGYTTVGFAQTEKKILHSYDFPLTQGF